MRWTRTIGMGAATLLATIAVTVASASASPVWPKKIYGHPGTGCPSGAVCIYPTSDNFATGPEHGGIYYSYGPHNLHDQLGVHLVYNNQYPVAGYETGFTFCGGYNGTGQYDSGLTGQGRWAPFYLSPINSITLYDVYDWRQYEYC